MRSDGSRIRLANFSTRSRFGQAVSWKAQSVRHGAVAHRSIRSPGQRSQSFSSTGTSPASTPLSKPCAQAPDPGSVAQRLFARSSRVFSRVASTSRPRVRSLNSARRLPTAFAPRDGRLFSYGSISEKNGRQEPNELSTSNKLTTSSSVNDALHFGAFASVVSTASGTLQTVCRRASTSAPIAATSPSYFVGSPCEASRRSQSDRRRSK